MPRRFDRVLTAAILAAIAISAARAQDEIVIPATVMVPVGVGAERIDPGGSVTGQETGIRLRQGYLGRAVLAYRLPDHWDGYQTISITLGLAVDDPGEPGDCDVKMAGIIYPQGYVVNPLPKVFAVPYVPSVLEHEITPVTSLPEWRTAVVEVIRWGGQAGGDWCESDVLVYYVHLRLLAEWPNSKERRR